MKTLQGRTVKNQKNLFQQEFQDLIIFLRKEYQKDQAFLLLEEPAQEKQSFVYNFLLITPLKEKNAIIWDLKNLKND